ncbi:alpha/beta hydrolase [Teichococcus rhizosphaerae]|nr:alpha/beta hydrolase-fold protein [Pseudoroseomonas rhizosphaerae]
MTAGRRALLTMAGLGIGGLGVAGALPALAPRAARAQRVPNRPAEVIEDPLVERFDLGLGDGPAWRIQLARPATPPPAAGYPVLTVLDGNALFPLAWRMREAAGAAGVALLAIGHPTEAQYDFDRRFLDLTPATPAEAFGPRRDNPPPTGGRGRFLAFIETALRPAVAARLPVDPGRQALFGHSLGGLFGLHVLFTRPELFRAYALSDPSIWWNGRSILEEQAAFLGGLRAAGGRVSRPLEVLVAVAGITRPGPFRAAGGDGPGGRETARALATIPGLRAAFRRVEGEGHGGMVPQAMADALALAAGRMPEGTALP